MSIVGWYYLHENGDLIYKPDADAISDIRDSDFSRCAWSVDPSNRKGAWEILIESLALGANPDRVVQLAEKWKCTDADAEIFAEVVGVIIVQDGNAWIAHRKDFIDLQSSPAGVGKNKLEAMANLAKDMGIQGGNFWRSTFSELLEIKSVSNGN